MTNLNWSSLMEGNAALISIHPKYVSKILAGEKRIEFRRSWATKRVDWMVIYATAPVKRIVAVSEVGDAVYGTKTQLWELGKKKGGGISRRTLFAYMAGKKMGVALELLRTHKFPEAISPQRLLGEGFRAPQSFRYMSQSELALLTEHLGDSRWA